MLHKNRAPGYMMATPALTKAEDEKVVFIDDMFPTPNSGHSNIVTAKSFLPAIGKTSSTVSCNLII